MPPVYGPIRKVPRVVTRGSPPKPAGREATMRRHAAATRPLLVGRVRRLPRLFGVARIPALMALNALRTLTLCCDVGDRAGAGVRHAASAPHGNLRLLPHEPSVGRPLLHPDPERA